MAKLTQFGRMRRRIKKELQAARLEHALSIVQASAVISAGVAQVQLITSAVMTARSVKAASKIFAGERAEREEDRLP